MERKDKLFEVALDEFIEKGYDKASLNNILKKASISKGSFYYHFKNKGELYLYIFRKLHSFQHEYVDKWREENNPDYESMNAFDILRLEGRTGLELANKHPKYYQFWKTLYEEKSLEAKGIVDKELQELIENGHPDNELKPIIDKGLRNKDFREDMSREFIEKILLHSLMSFFHCFVKEDGDFEMDKLQKNYEQYIDFLENGLSNYSREVRDG